MRLRTSHLCMQSMMLSSQMYPPFRRCRHPRHVPRRSAVGRQRRRRPRGASLVVQRQLAEAGGDDGRDASPDAPPSQSVSNLDFVLVVPTRLHRLRHCRPPAEKPLPKLAERDLQVIACILPCFRVSVIVIFRCDAAAIVALPLLPPNEQHANVDRGHRHRCD